MAHKLQLLTTKTIRRRKWRFVCLKPLLVNWFVRLNSNLLKLHVSNLGQTESSLHLEVVMGRSDCGKFRRSNWFPNSPVQCTQLVLSRLPTTDRLLLIAPLTHAGAVTFGLSLQRQTSIWLHGRRIRRESSMLALTPKVSDLR